MTLTFIVGLTLLCNGILWYGMLCYAMLLRTQLLQQTSKQQLRLPGSSHTNLDDHHTMPKELPWRRLHGEKCHVPNKLQFRIDSGGK